MQHGLLSRISRSSIMEYHAFGIVSYVSFLNYRCISGAPCTYLVSQGRNTCKISLPNLWGERRLYSKTRPRSANPSLDAAAKGTFLRRSVVIMRPIATSVCRILEHLISLPQGDTCMHGIRNWLGPFHVPSGASFYPM